MEVTELQVTEEIELTGAHCIIIVPAAEGEFEKVEMEEAHV